MVTEEFIENTPTPAEKVKEKGEQPRKTEALKG